MGFITPEFAAKLTQIGVSEDLESEQSGCMGAKRNTLFADVSNVTITPHQLELELQRSKKCRSSLAEGDHRMKGKSGACAPGGVLETLGAVAEGSSVPRVFHQSYMTHQLPADLLPYVHSWHGYFAQRGWRHVWWTDADNHWLVHTHYPQWAAAWDKLYHPIERADTARYFYLHRYGGLYADVDMAYFERRY
jgi:mannosyltransferase OCH1-like enzyme